MNRRTAIGLALALAAAAIVLALPAPSITPQAHRLGAIWIAIVIRWMTEALPFAASGLLAPTLVIMAGVATPREAFAAFGDPVLFQLVGSFFLARAFESSGLGRQIALLLLSTGLGGAIAEALRRAAGLHDALGVTALSVVLAVFQSETSSNTASATLIVPITIALSRSVGADPLAAALAATAASSLGFMLPVSTAPNAIVVGSGRVPLAVMIRYGLTLDLLGIVLLLGTAARFLQ